MKILKIFLNVVLGFGLLAFCYFFAVKIGFPVPNPLTKDLTFGVMLNSLPTKKVSDGLTTYVVYDEGAIEAADNRILEWYDECQANQGGESLAKMKSEVKLITSVYEKIKEAERLTTDGTPEQKLLMMEIQLITRLHSTLATGINMSLRYGFN